MINKRQRPPAGRADLSISDLAAVLLQYISESFPFIQKQFRFTLRLLFMSSYKGGRQLRPGPSVFMRVAPLVSLKPRREN